MARKIRAPASLLSSLMPLSMFSKIPKVTPKRAARAPPRRPLASGAGKCKPSHVQTGEPKKGGQAVYVLELEKGRVYVGKSGDVDRRLKQHMAGTGAEFTKLFRPTGRLLPRLGDLEGSGDGPERDETLRQMHVRGMDKVRGWRYCAKTLGKEDRADIEANLRELHDLCRSCGSPGHMARYCPKKRRK